jgi:uncharacterized glyoxalase superfamily protein PhnB
MAFLKLEPMLQTIDLVGTIDWYCTVLAFRLDARSEQWCRLERDGTALMFMTNAHLGSPQATATQYFYIDDVAALFETVRPHCKIEWGPEVMPYGNLEFAIRDNNGYLLSFSQKVD